MYGFDFLCFHSLDVKYIIFFFLFDGFINILDKKLFFIFYFFTITIPVFCIVVMIINKTFGLIEIDQRPPKEIKILM